MSEPDTQPTDISRSIAILSLVDEFVAKPGAQTRANLRAELLKQFAQARAQGLIEAGLIDFDVVKRALADFSCRPKISAELKNKALAIARQIASARS